MEFETEMKRLTTELMGAFENRTTAVREAQTNTRNQIRTNQSTRGAMAAEQRQHLHQQMNDLRHHTADYMNRTATARMDMSRKQSNMLGDTNMARKQASDQKQHELDDFMNQLRTTNGAFMQAVGAMRAEMSAEQHDRLISTKAQLTADMTVMRQGMQAAQAAVQADLAAAHTEWLRFTGAKVGKQPADAQPAPRPEPAQPVMATPPMATQVIATPPIPDHATSDVEDEKKKKKKR